MTILNTTELFFTTTGNTSTQFTTSTSSLSGQLAFGLWADDLLYNYNVLDIVSTSTNPNTSLFYAPLVGQLNMNLVNQFSYIDARSQTINIPISLSYTDTNGSPLGDGSISINSINQAITLRVVQPITYLSFTPFSNITGELNFNNYSNFNNNGSSLASVNIYVQATYVNVSANQNTLQVATNTSGYSGQQRQIWLS
jgi:hypothetical protein